jgi:hypothetical protein
MSENTARRDPHAKPEDADVTEPRKRKTEHKQVVRLRRPVAQPADGGGASPDEPDADEFELIGGIDDLGAADLGPIAPNTHDPDADSVRPRK